VAGQITIILMKKILFRLLHSINNFGVHIERIPLQNKGYKIDKQEYHVYQNQTTKLTRFAFIIITFSAMGIFVKNSNETISVLGYNVIVWKFSILLAIVFSIPSAFLYLTNDTPKITFTHKHIKIKYIGTFKWDEIAAVNIESHYNYESYGKQYFLAIKYQNDWYRTTIEEMKISKEEIEAIVEYFWENK